MCAGVLDAPDTLAGTVFDSKWLETWVAQVGVRDLILRVLNGSRFRNDLHLFSRYCSTNGSQPYIRSYLEHPLLMYNPHFFQNKEHEIRLVRFALKKMIPWVMDASPRIRDKLMPRHFEGARAVFCITLLVPTVLVQSFQMLYSTTFEESTSFYLGWSRKSIRRSRLHRGFSNYIMTESLEPDVLLFSTSSSRSTSRCDQRSDKPPGTLDRCGLCLDYRWGAGPWVIDKDGEFIHMCGGFFSENDDVGLTDQDDAVLNSVERL